MRPKKVAILSYQPSNWQNSKSQQWFRDHPDKVRANSRRHLYCLTTPQYAALKLYQAGMCAICKQKMATEHIDHDHKHCGGEHSCGVCIRGLLCNDCNRGLGSFHDNPQYMTNALEYLQKTNYMFVLQSIRDVDEPALVNSKAGKGDFESYKKPRVRR